MNRKENMRGKLVTAAAALLIASGAAWGTWRDAQPAFQDVTIQVEEQIPQLDSFLTAYAAEEKCELVTDLGSVDTGVAGDYPVVLRSGTREQTVTLHIQDNLAPELQVQDLEVPVGTQLAPEDFVTHLQDHSQVQLSFAEPLEMPEDHGSVEVEIVAEDAHGNVSRAACTASFRWLRSQVVLEYGEMLTREDLLYAPEKDAELISDEDLERINTGDIGETSLKITVQGVIQVCKVTIQDTRGPELELREYQVFLGHKAEMEDFIVSATDPSGEVTLTMLTELDFTQAGSQTVQIRAEDIHGNVTVAETTFYVATDTVPPVIQGAEGELTVDKHSQPDYLAGVSATDARDGTVEVTVDDSKVDLTRGGTYFLTYTARDSSGNVTTLRRKVIVNHDAEDTAALVQELADSLEDDPEAIRDYVRKTIYYSTNWGGDDPVWMGFTEKHGNCYVHALCLKSILDLKGYNTQLIWVTAKSHYWLIIEIEPGVWRHIDATPSELHSRYSLMTDEQRYWTLSGRDWDRSQWPACE